MWTKAMPPIRWMLAALVVIAAVAIEARGGAAEDPKKDPNKTVVLPPSRPAAPELNAAQEREMLAALKENAPEEYKRLEELRKTNPAAYKSAAGYAWQWYETWKHAPKEVQAAVIQERQAFLEIAHYIRDIRTEKNPAAQAELTKKLRDAACRHFDAEQKISEYRITQFEARIKQLRLELEQRSKDRTRLVDERIDKWMKVPPKAEETGTPTPTTKPAD